MDTPCPVPLPYKAHRPSFARPFLEIQTLTNEFYPLSLSESISLRYIIQIRIATKFHTVLPRLIHSNDYNNQFKSWEVPIQLLQMFIVAYFYGFHCYWITPISQSTCTPLSDIGQLWHVAEKIYVVKKLSNNVLFLEKHYRQFFCNES